MVPDTVTLARARYDRWRDAALTVAPDLTVVIPAFNEERRILPTVAAIAGHLTQMGRTFEIIVSDDGSTDNTVSVVRSLGLANVYVLAPGYNRGKGAAVRDAMLAARGRVVLFTDADNSTPIQELDTMLDAIDDGASVVIASRAADGASTAHRTPLRLTLSAVLQLLMRVVLALPVRDSQCGFKVFRRDAARVIFARQRIDGFSFDLEVLHLARRLGHRIVEIPVMWVDAPGSKVSPVRTTLGFLRDLVKIRLLHARERQRPATAAARPRPHIAVVTAHPPSQATLTEYGLHLVRHLQGSERVGTLTVLCDDRNGVPPSLGGNVDVVPGWRFGSPVNALRIAWHVWRRRPDGVIFNVHFTSFASGKVASALGLAAPALCRLLRVPTLVILHNFIDTVDLKAAGFDRGPVINAVMVRLGRILTRVVLLADRVVTTMPEYVDILRSAYGASNVYLAPHGSFEDTGHPDPDTTDGRRRILAFGKFGTYKRLEPLLDAVGELQSRGGYGDVEVVIAGSDSPNAKGYLEGIEQRYGTVDGVTFTGYVAEEDIPALFCAASVVVFPYTGTTGSSGPLHQAGTYARAAVVPNVGDFIDLIGEEGFVGEPFDVDDPNTLADALARVLDDEEHRRDLGRRNYAAAVSLPLSDIIDWQLLHLEMVRVKRAGG